MDDLKQCEPLSLAQFSKRPFLSKLTESVVRLFSPLM